MHFYDRLKKQANNRNNLALLKLKHDAILRVPRDVESFAFRNNMDLTRYQHNKTMVNATQSQQYLMDLIDQKFEKLKDQIYKLGIQPAQFRNMVESQTLFEWSSEVALSFSTRFCSWVVQEDAAEDELTVDDRSQQHQSAIQPLNEAPSFGGEYAQDVSKLVGMNEGNSIDQLP